MQAHEYTLYIRRTCPFCLKVLRYMDSEDIVLPIIDINGNTSAADDLIAIGGKQQVPCLVIDGKAMYESDDIVAYMRQHLDELK